MYVLYCLYPCLFFIKKKKISAPFYERTLQTTTNDTFKIFLPKSDIPWASWKGFALGTLFIYSLSIYIFELSGRVFGLFFKKLRGGLILWSHQKSGLSKPLVSVPCFPFFQGIIFKMNSFENIFYYTSTIRSKSDSRSQFQGKFLVKCSLLWSKSKSLFIIYSFA